MVQAELQEWVASGNVRRAASSLVVDYSADVLATCLAMVRDRTAAEDLTQDVFSDAIRGLPSFRGESAPRTWLLSIARNRCIDWLRARKRDPWGGAVDDDTRDPDAHPDEAASGASGSPIATRSTSRSTRSPRATARSSSSASRTASTTTSSRRPSASARARCECVSPALSLVCARSSTQRR